jgi:hypothetical protein
MEKSDFLDIIYIIKIRITMEKTNEKYEKRIKEIEKIAVTISLTSDPDLITSLRKIMRIKIEEALSEKNKD